MYDAIVIGARCRKHHRHAVGPHGYHVLLVNKAAFPVDVSTTTYIHQPGIAQLQRWGLLPQVIRSGCPRLSILPFAAGAVTLTGARLR